MGQDFAYVESSCKNIENKEKEDSVERCKERNNNGLFVGGGTYIDTGGED